MDDGGALAKLLQRGPWERSAEDEAKAAARRKQYEARRRIERLTGQGVSERDARLVWSGELRDTAAIAAAKLTGECLVLLLGGVGCGKSVAAANWLAKSKSPVNRYSRNPRRWIRASVLTEFGALEDANGRALLHAAHLVIDDLGTEVKTSDGRGEAAVFRLVDERWGNMLPTLITSNLNAKELAQRYGRRFHDRIRAYAHACDVTGKSLRR